MLGRDWIDVTADLGERTPTWPSDPRLERELIATHADDGVDVSVVRMSLHTGTHLDAPSHYIAGGATIGALPFDATMGPCVVIDATGVDVLDARWIERVPIAAGARILFRTKNSTRHLMRQPQFSPRFVHLTPDAAELLVERHVRCVGIDYLSIGSAAHDGDMTHRILLSSGVWIIEGLDLAGVAPGPYELLCLPMNFSGAEGAPVRALLRPPRTHDDDEIGFIDDALEWATKAG